MHQTGQIIVLDRDPQILLLIRTTTGRPALSFPSALDFQKKWNEVTPVAFFFDVQLKTCQEGLKFVPLLKERWPFCPIIVIADDPQAETLSEALASGADDFICKPLKPKELLARLQARLDSLAKRQFKEVEPIGDLIVDKTHRTLSSSSKKATRHLSPTEMNLLLCLLHAKGTLVQRDTLKRRCWGQVYVSDNALNRKLHEVRHTIRELSTQVEIKTLYGVGFVLEITGRSLVEDTGVEPVTSTLPALRSTR